ncbi:hypothetical protein ABIC78_004164 [Novosphingobium sp. 1529]|uniref:hypothetical protein n=1 Tax=Novosphingobium sp. 1529 TaxID=3156424 RepID=UPI003395ED31
MDDTEFKETVMKNTVVVLKRLFPNEARSYAAILQRTRTGSAKVSYKLRSFKAFLLAVGRQPSPEYTIDRSDTYDPEYAPGKIRWASPKEQANNRKTTIRLRGENGEIWPLTTWAKKTGQNPATLRKRHSRGWSDIDVIKGKRRISDRDRHQRAGLKGESEWPDGLKISEWETPYQDWIRTRGKALKEDTRLVFFAWVAMGAMAWFERELAKQFPSSFGPEATPDDDPEIDDMPLYQDYCRRRALLQAVLRQLSASERANLQTLRKRIISNPKDAVSKSTTRRSI